MESSVICPPSVFSLTWNCTITSSSFLIDIAFSAANPQQQQPGLNRRHRERVQCDVAWGVNVVVVDVVVVVWLDFDRSFGQSKDYFASQKKKVPFSLAIGNLDLMNYSVFPNTLAWEEQEWNKIKKQKVRRRRDYGKNQSGNKIQKSPRPITT